MRFVFKHKRITAAFVTFLFCFLVLPVTERLAFTLPSDKMGFVVSYLLKFLFSIFLYFVLYFALTFIEQVRAKNEQYIRWLKYSAIYLSIMAVFLVLVYPGNWLWDEFIILHEVKNYSLFAWQNYFTNIFYTFCLYLFPSGMSIVIVQLVFASLVVGYIISRAQTLLRNQKLAYWLFIPFLLIPVIYYNLYPLRLTVYSYIELLMLFKLILLHLRPQEVANKYYEFIYITILITLLSFWRSEGIFYLLLLPYVAYRLRLFNRQQLKNFVPYAWVTGSLLIIVTAAAITKYTSEPLYQLSVTLNPLSTMIQQDLKGSKVDESLKSIDKVVRLDVLKKKPSYKEVPALWEGGIRPDHGLHISEYNKAAVYLIVNNPGPFLDNRLKTFLAANSFDTTIPQIRNGGLLYFESDPVIDRFRAENRFVESISSRAKLKTTQILLAVDSNNRNTFFAHIIWNIIPIVVLLVAAAVWSLLRKAYFWVFLISLVLIRFVLLSLTAPAAYFMYYLPVYMSGLLLITLMLLFYFDRDNKQQSTKTRAAI